jgi:hypothetical protein
VPKEEGAVETIGAPKDRYGDRHLDVGRCQTPKKLTQGDGGSRRKLAAIRRRMTLRAVPSLHKGHYHKAPTVEKRRWKGPECTNGIRSRGLKEQIRVGNKENAQ